MKKITFIKGLALLRKTFKNYEIDKDLYWTILKDLSDKNYEKAIIKVIEEQKELYPGTNLIAIIKEKALDMNYTAPYLAWNEVTSQLHFYAKPKYSNPVIDSVVSIIGWRELCNMELRDRYLRKQFFDIYAQEIKEDYKQQLSIRTKPIKSEESKYEQKNIEGNPEIIKGEGK